MPLNQSREDRSGGGELTTAKLLMMMKIQMGLIQTMLKTQKSKTVALKMTVQTRKMTVQIRKMTVQIRNLRIKRMEKMPRTLKI